MVHIGPTVLETAHCRSKTDI